MNKIVISSSNEDSISFEIQAIQVEQPMGNFFIASIPHDRLYNIAYFDVRRMLKERDVEEYLGIQRPLSESRAQELKQYVRTVDACFPTAIVLAVDRRCASYDVTTGKLTLKNYLAPDEGEQPILYRQIAKVLDGQHRIAGLEGLPADYRFDLNVSIFVDIELEDQAYIFSIVNLAQTKVNKSLAYDLFELANSRSPQKTCHNIAVLLDRNKESPFHHRIKRLGSATPGRPNQEVLTQATVVEGLMPFISKTPIVDRDQLKREGKISAPTRDELKSMPLRGLFAEEKDLIIADIFWNYFSAVRNTWPRAWDSSERGMILNRTNGFRALMRVFRPLYSYLAKPGEVPPTFKFEEHLKKISLRDIDFNTENFKPGTSGEAQLAEAMLVGMGFRSP